MNPIGPPEETKPPEAGEARLRRRRRYRADARVEILDAAWQVADEEGIGAVALSEVARRVGMRAPSLYNYFPSKLAIIDAMFEQGAIDFRVAMSAPLEAYSDADVVREMGRRFVAFATERPARFELLFHRPVPGFFPAETSFAPAIEADEAVSERLVAVGLGDPVIQAFCRAAIIGIANQQIASPWDPDLGIEMVDAAADVILGIAARRAGAQPKSR